MIYYVYTFLRHFYVSPLFEFISKSLFTNYSNRKSLIVVWLLLQRDVLQQKIEKECKKLMSILFLSWFECTVESYFKIDCSSTIIASGDQSGKLKAESRC